MIVLPFYTQTFLTLFRMGFLGAAYGWGAAKTSYFFSLTTKYFLSVVVTFKINLYEFHDQEA